MCILSCNIKRKTSSEEEKQSVGLVKSRNQSLCSAKCNNKYVVGQTALGNELILLIVITVIKSKMYNRMLSRFNR